MNGIARDAIHAPATHEWLAVYASSEHATSSFGLYMLTHCFTKHYTYFYRSTRMETEKKRMRWLGDTTKQTHNEKNIIFLF